MLPLTYPRGCLSSSLRTVCSQNSNTKWSRLFLLKTSSRLTRFTCFSCCRANGEHGHSVSAQQPKMLDKMLNSTWHVPNKVTKAHNACMCGLPVCVHVYTCAVRCEQTWYCWLMLISSHLQHTYFSQCNLLNDRVIFRFHKLLDGNYLAAVSVSAFEHHTVRTLTNFGQLFIFLHGAVSSCHLSKGKRFHKITTSLITWIGLYARLWCFLWSLQLPSDTVTLQKWFLLFFKRL